MKPTPKRQLAIIAATGKSFIEFVAVPDIIADIQRACDDDDIGRLEYSETGRSFTFWVNPYFDLDECVAWFKELDDAQD